ncbi:MAG: hypothetical protein JXA90_02715, partial [Planctomycetes bacterium]|nr:hypothetical protein [Planctomycetota bacterium]
MKAICEILRPSLRLYAAGELEDRSTLLRVRRHLDRCAACRRFLREHDALLRRVLAGACEASSGLGCWDARDAESAEDVDTRRERIARRGAAEAARRRRRILSRIEELPLPRADRRLRIPPPRSVLSSLSAAAALVFLALLAGLLWRQGDAERPAAPRRRLAALPAAAVASAASIARPERAAAQEPSLADLLWTRSSFHVAAELGLPRSASRVIVLHAFAAPDAG